MRWKTLLSEVEVEMPKVVQFDANSSEHNILYFDVEKLVQKKLLQSVLPLPEGYQSDCTPIYVQGMKETMQLTTLVSSYLDSPAHAKILETVPMDERPPVLLQIYADDIDRDQTLHSTLKNRLHCTYVRVMNTTQFGQRSKDDYSLAVLAKSTTNKKFGYANCQKTFINNLKALVSNGIFINGKKHAVRVAQLQSDGLERARQIGMKESFSTVKYIDPFSLITRDERLNLHPIDVYDRTKQLIRTKEMYDEAIAELESARQPSDINGLVIR